jgi:hypothetical protein
VWQFGLYPLDDQRTRFVTRGTERVPKKLGWWLAMRITEPTAFIMTRRMLLNLKERAEALSAATSWSERAEEWLAAPSSGAASAPG